MKIRLGFVSNSSSSSFICDLTGESFSGWDASLRDFNLIKCEKGHVLIADYSEEIEAFLKAKDEEGETYIPSALCPICNGSAKSKVVSRVISMMKRLNVTKEDLDAHC